jgi:hypothetical protein
MSIGATILNIFRFNRKNWKAVSLCILTATVFWFFNALNKNYSTNITFPLEFDFDQENFIPVTPLPTQVKLNVTGIGWDLFRRSSGLKVPSLVIPLERPAEVKKIVAVPGLFAHQLERFNINFVLSDTFRVQIDPIERRWITLRLDTKSIALRDGYIRISEPELDPDSIHVEGPLSLIKTFIEPLYLKLSDKSIDETYEEDVEVEFLHNELIKRNPPTVHVAFKVDKLITLNDSLPLKIINYPKGANPYLGIKALPCNYSVPESLMNTYVRDSVKAVIDLRYFTKGIKQIKPEVVGLPHHSVVNSIDSIFVKF